MGKALLALLICATVLSSLARPWIGISSYYLLSILGPQYIWWWTFEGLRVSLFVAIFALTGVASQLLKRKYDLCYLINRQNLWLALLWLSLTISYFFGPYVTSYSSYGLNSDQLFSITNTIFILYFCAVLEINNLNKLHYLMLVFALSTVYLVYWANNQYFIQNWDQFDMGRLKGPRGADGSSIYQDQNAFAMLFVTGVPFIYYFGWEFKRKWQRCLIWSAIPFAWHAVFLTGSRGALIGLGVVTVLKVLLTKKRWIVFPLVVLFILFYQWQAGDVMRERSREITDIEGEKSAEDRILAWRGGVKMIEAHPLTGTGLGTFVYAVPNFYDVRPMVAHNTLIQFAAESGIFAGISYLAIVSMFFINAKRIRNWCRENEYLPENVQIERYNNASVISFTGLFVCSLFLSLNTYEIFFVLLIFNNALLQICLRTTKSEFK